MDYSLLIGVHNLDVAANALQQQQQDVPPAPAQSECSMGEGGSNCGAAAAGESVGAFERQGSKVRHWPDSEFCAPC